MTRDPTKYEALDPAHSGTNENLPIPGAARSDWRIQTMPSTMRKEEQLIAAGRGKWSQPGVPHRGWLCVGTEDLGEPLITCEMCEFQTIRYVHVMEHPSYAEVLRVGCICAGHMEGDLAAARQREASLQSRAGKRKRWVNLKWKISRKGNPWIVSDGHRITVRRRGPGWATTISARGGTWVHHSCETYPSQDDAKLAAFDYITQLSPPRQNRVV